MHSLSVPLMIGIILLYFGMLIGISIYSSKDENTFSFFTANKNSHWLLVAFGMIGASLSGVTFISLPGVVGKEGYNQNFAYMQMVFGYLIGYMIIALVLLPLYYKMNVVSIYEYLRNRFGKSAHLVGAFYFLISRIVGASLRLYLVAIVLQKFILDRLGIPFYVTVGITILFIWTYTYSGGIKTIVITDTIQTFCMLLVVVLCIIYIGAELGWTIADIIVNLRDSSYSKMWYTEVPWQDPNNLWKQLISGALIALVMTGLDQDMMQKNLTCRTLKDAQKNMYTFSIILIFANVLFLSLGALLYTFASTKGIEIPTQTDQLFPTIALQYLPAGIGIAFLLGLISAAYSSADSALTSLTTSYCVDFLNLPNTTYTESQKKIIRIRTHIAFSMIIFLVVVLTRYMGGGSVINDIFIAAGYTYGPILGLFMFGITTKKTIRNAWVIPICIMTPIISFLLVKYSDYILGGFEFGGTIIALNGFLTFIGLWMISKPQNQNDPEILKDLLNA